MISHPVTFFGSLLPLIAWLLYNVLAARLEQNRPSLSIIMSNQRRRWVENAVRRETPLDGILSGNLMSSVSFFASTTVLIILGIFATFSQLPAITEAVSHIQPVNPPNLADIQLHVIIAFVMFGMAFLSFTLSLRQFNHFCIMLGAANQKSRTNNVEIGVITALNTLGARNFNQGLRAYYFAIPMVVWFAAPWASAIATIFILLSILYREFYSAARNLVAQLDQPGVKR